MEGKWTADLASVLRNSHKAQPITVTCKGDDASFNVYKHALASQFTQNPLTWKRGTKTFPYRLTFPLKFVPFHEKLCWNTNAPDFNSTAFLHVFFVCPQSVDEYKTSVRHLVSEWFALVSSLTDVQWLIVVDSTKAKEKKNRTTLMDKIKSDFSKYQAKVVEVSESVEHGSFLTLAQAVQASVLGHLETLVQAWETRLSLKKDQYRDENWNFIEYFRLVTDFAKLFWSIGALEHSLSIYDDLDRFLGTIVVKVADDSSGAPFWVQKFRKTESPTCPTIRRLLSTGLDLPISSYLDVRHSLLCQQIVLSLHMYYLRSRSKGAAPSIRVDFAAILLKYAQHCQMSVSEHTKLLGFAIPLTRLACWTIFLVGDSLNICGLLSDPSSVTAATSSLCHIHTERFNSMMILCEDPKDPTLVEWLEKSHLEDGSILIDSLKETSVFYSQLQKIHDTSSTVLVQSGRPRIAAYIGWRFAKWLSANDKRDQALPYKLRYLTRLLEDQFRSPQVVSMIQEVLPQLSEDRDRERILSYLLLLSMQGKEEDSLNRFIKLASRSDKKVSLETITPKGHTFLDVKLHSHPDIVLPLEELKIEISVVNKFLQSVSFTHCSLKVKAIDYTVLTRSEEPVFEIIYSKFSSDMKKRGCFVLDSLEMTIFGGISVRVSNLDNKKDPALIFIGSNPHKIWVEESKDYLAGLVQTIEVSLEAGCNLDATVLFVCGGGEEAIEFENKDKGWVDKIKYSVKALNQGEQTKFRIPVYVALDSNMTDSPAVRRVKFLVEWENRSWMLEVPFVALFHTSTRTSQLETQNLLELEISRSLASDWTVIIESINLEIAQDSKPSSLGKLLNPELEELAPNTVSNLVFLIPLDGEVPLEHTLKLDYLVKSTRSSEQQDRRFRFKMDLQMRVRSCLYEVCTQMLSQNPGAQLCRADSPCDLVVSLRSLKHSVELLYIVLEADSKLWTLNERAKVLQVKESGLGQIVFSVVPCAAGLLPYPSVSVYSCVSVGPRSLDGAWNEGVDVLPGSPLVSFHRTAGKQIRVLGASQSSTRMEEKKAGLKQKFVKLFD